MPSPPRRKLLRSTCSATSTNTSYLGKLILQEIKELSLKGHEELAAVDQTAQVESEIVWNGGRDIWVGNRHQRRRKAVVSRAAKK